MLAFIIFGILGIGVLAENSENIPSQVCNLKADTGPCRALVPRYYFNSSEKSCLKFNYGGCTGNKNNFKTEEECINFCIKSVTPSSSDIKYQIPTPLLIQTTTMPTVPETLQNPSDTSSKPTESTPKPTDFTTPKPNGTTPPKPTGTTTKPNGTFTPKPNGTSTPKPKV